LAAVAALREVLRSTGCSIHQHTILESNAQFSYRTGLAELPRRLENMLGMVSFQWRCGLGCTTSHTDGKLRAKAVATGDGGDGVVVT
jgi:hypothetical protein